MKTGSAVLIALFLVFCILSNSQATTYTYAPVNYPDASNTWAYSINNWGTIVGLYAGGQGFSVSGGTYSSLNYPNAAFTSADGVNDAGTIVGGTTTRAGWNMVFPSAGGPIPS
jgi:hypothetical protein